MVPDYPHISIAVHLREHVEDDVPPHPEEQLPGRPGLVGVHEGVQLEVHVVDVLQLQVAVPHVRQENIHLPKAT